jgi:hypothetical protein
MSKDANQKTIKKISKKSSGVPKIVHQIWLGPRDPPLIWMNTWKDGFCKKYNWEYRLWRDSDIKNFKLKNEVSFKDATSWQQKADIARYEIVHKFGGLYLDVDMIWLKKDLEKYIPFSTSHFIGVQEYLSSNFKNIGKPFISNGFFAASKGNSILKCCIDTLPKRLKLSNKAFITTGPGLVNGCVNVPITIIPTEWVFPVNFTGLATGDEKNFLKTALVFTKSGFEMPYLANASLQNKLKLVLERFLYV